MSDHIPDVTKMISDAFGKPMYEADPTNARYNSLQLQCYEQRKEINRLNEHLQLKEELLSEIERENERLKEQNKRQNEAIDSLREMYAKEAKL
jgi:membrane protein involved in colicin uptake